MLEGHTRRVNSCNFSPCGNFIVSGSDGKTIKIWEVSYGSLLKTLKQTGYIT